MEALQYYKHNSVNTYKFYSIYLICANHIVHIILLHSQVSQKIHLPIIPSDVFYLS